MLTNYCIYDCAYCINRRSNDIPRATFSVTELVQLTIEFYRRNYIEGLFLSSGVVRNPDYTMERLVKTIKDLREIYHFNGYIHAKAIPGADPGLTYQLGLLADRLSVNIELPSESSLRLLAPGREMVYSTCSILRMENEDVVNAALRSGRAELVPIDHPMTAHLPLLPTSLPGTLCVCPDGLHEGFFAAKLRKKR